MPPTRGRVGGEVPDVVEVLIANQPKVELPVEISVVTVQLTNTLTSIDQSKHVNYKLVIPSVPNRKHNLWRRLP